MTPKKAILTSFVFGAIILVFSFTFIDPNLIFFANIAPLVDIQHFLFSFGRDHAVLNGLIFSLLLILWYPWVKSLLKLRLKTIIIVSLIISAFGIVTYPAFSHDLFNYIFNAKILTIYHQNPAQVSPFSFVNQDDWVRFMHNTKAISPYGLAWRYISAVGFYLFYSISPSFLSAFIGLKLVNFISFWIAFYFIYLCLKLLQIKDIKTRLTFFLLNPLILWEGLYMAHNDMLMATFAIISFYFLVKAKQAGQPSAKQTNLLLTAFFLALSIATKYATIVLIPVYIWYLIKPKLDISLYATLALFLTAFARWPWLHSWYFIWPISFFVLNKNLKIIKFFWIFSFFLMIRYLPFAIQRSWSLYHFREVILLLGIPISIAIINKTLKRFNSLKLKHAF
ncbi:MAG: hypothetical protein GXP43_03025 [bacterium]|nr:hypothetical protein [bacterium]